MGYRAEDAFFDNEHLLPWVLSIGIDMDVIDVFLALESSDFKLSLDNLCLSRKMVGIF